MPRPKKPIKRSATRVRMASRDAATVTTVALETTVHQRLMMQAIKRNWTLSTILRAAAAEWLERHEDTTKGGPR